MKMQKFTKFVKKYLKTKLLKISKYCKVRDHCNYTGENRGVAHFVCNLRYTVHKEIPIVFHNGYNYEYYCIIKDLTKELEGKFHWRRKLQELTEKGKRYHKNNILQITNY